MERTFVEKVTGEICDAKDGDCTATTSRIALSEILEISMDFL